MKKSLLLLIFYFLCKNLAWAQPNCFYAENYPPSATQIKVCVGREITMKDDGCTSQGNVLFRFSGATNVNGAVGQKNFTFTQTGVYTATRFANPTSEVARINYIQVLPTPKPKLRLLRCAGGFKINFTEFAPYDRYRVKITGNPDVFATTNPSAVFPLPNGSYNISVVGEYNVGRIAGTDAPFESGVNADTTISNFQIYSNINQLPMLYPSQITKEGVASTCDGKIKVVLPKVFADIRYEIAISKNGQAFETLQVLENINQDNFSLEIDKLNNLGQSHTIRLSVRDVCGGTASQNTIIPEEIPNLPRKLTNVNASFNLNNTLLISWKASGFTQTDINTYQVVENGRVLDATTNNQLGFSDKMTANSCYTVEFTTACGIKTLFSDAACPMILKVEGDLKERRLQWTPYKNSENEIVLRYEVIKINGIGGAIDNFSAGTNTFYTDNEEDLENQVIQYRILAVTASGGEYFSNVVRIERPVRVFFPNVFTPNNDGLNDIFFPKGLFIKTLKMEVFNSNGQKIFESAALGEGWDGTFQGKPMPVGVYIYHYEVEDLIGNRLRDSGSFLLQR
jgi:gliding motility-associated-like protein